MGRTTEENYGVKFVPKGTQNINATCFLNGTMQILLLMKAIDKYYNV